MKVVIGFIAFLFPVFLLAQNSDTDRYFEQQVKQNKYDKSKKFKGPDDWNSSYPSSMSDYYYEDYDRFEEDLPMESILSEEKLGESRMERYGNEYGEGVVKKPNPDIIPPNPVELPDIDLPDVNLPDIDLPSIGTWEFWKVVLLLIVVAAFIFLIYILISKLKPLDSKVSLNVDDEWNPTVITKSELEQKLEKAQLGNDYRECVRIHFMFILKELIAGNYIDWKSEKTNYDYLLETRKSKGYDGFGECVRIYDLVWYGDYEITLQDYNRLKPALETYYQSLNPNA